MIEELPEDLLHNLNKSSAWNHPAGKRTELLLANLHGLKECYFTFDNFIHRLISVLEEYSLTLENIDLDGKFLGKCGIITYYLVKDDERVGGISIWYERLKLSAGYNISSDLEYDYS